MKGAVFLSYTSALSALAERIELSLEGEGFEVFRDRSKLPPGESFDARIRTAIEESNLFVFLITPESVSPGRYTLTELKFAEAKWGHPAGHVLPVFAEATPKEAIPAFLRAVTILQPRGDIVAEVAAEVARLGAPWWRRMLEPRRLVPAVFAALLLAAGTWMVLPPYLERRAQNAKVETLVKQSQSHADAGNSANAWKLLQEANAVAPASRNVIEARELLAMRMLRHVGVNNFSAAGRGASEDLVKTTLPVLSSGTSDATGERLGDLLAHMGWADYLRGGRSDSGGPDPAKHYQLALGADPGNVYAHAMWGFELLRKRGSNEALAKARQHFAAALESRKERAYVRNVQVSALLQSYSNVWIEDPERQREVIRAVNEMRMNDETRPKGWGPGSFKGKVWPIYHFGFVGHDEQAALLAALPPAEHLAAFRWLFPENDLTVGEAAPLLVDYLFVLARLEEHGGDRAGSLASYRRLLSEFAAKKHTSGRAAKMQDQAKEAIRRLDTN